jgi:hypothetical protein
MDTLKSEKYNQEFNYWTEIKKNDKRTLLELFGLRSDPSGHYHRYSYESCFGSHWGSTDLQKARQDVARTYGEYSY